VPGSGSLPLGSMKKLFLVRGKKRVGPSWFRPKVIYLLSISEVLTTLKSNEKVINKHSVSKDMEAALLLLLLRQFCYPEIFLEVLKNVRKTEQHC
jgi:hypothetical protein